jgi:multiple sugar transport system ATP-binding protein
VAAVETRHLTKIHRAGQAPAVDDVSLRTRDGEFVVFLGPSGSGKTTLLRLLAGLEEPTRGDVLLGDRVVTRLGPRERRIAMVFQSYALYPHLTVRRNIEFPLRVQDVPRADREARVDWAARLLGIGALLDRRPRELSGGERQRVALARAMVREPAVFLLDEPLSNLDAKLRASAREELAQFHRRLSTTTIYVTHDQVEAMALGERVVVLHQGRVRQVGTPREVYDEPADTFVAGFLGSPPMNLLETGDVLVGFRPEHLLPEALVPAPRAPLELRVESREYLGAERVLAGPPVSGPWTGQRVVARVPSTVPEAATEGDPLRLAVAEASLRFFDRGTGLRCPPRKLGWP